MSLHSPYFRVRRIYNDTTARAEIGLPADTLQSTEDPGQTGDDPCLGMSETFKDARHSESGYEAYRDAVTSPTNFS